MEYKSKFKAEEIDALLEKAKNVEKVYFFHLVDGRQAVNQDFISQVETAIQGGGIDQSALDIAKDMLQENNEILELIKEKPIIVHFEIGGVMAAVMKAMGQDPSQIGMFTLTIPAVAQYLAQGTETVQIVSIPVKDGSVGDVAGARYIYRRGVQNGTPSEELIRLTKSEATYEVPNPEGTIKDANREHNLSVLKYENYFDQYYVYTPSYNLCPVISHSHSGYGKDLYYMENGKLLKASVYKETGNVEVAIVHNFNS